MKYKFKSGDKVICKSNEYITIKENQCVTVDRYVDDYYFYIDEEIGVYNQADFIKGEKYE